MKTTLQMWMRDNGHRDKDIAEALGVDPSTISRWRTGVQTPPLWAAVRIEEMTKGEVKPAVFMTGRRSVG